LLGATSGPGVPRNPKFVDGKLVVVQDGGRNVMVYGPRNVLNDLASQNKVVRVKVIVPKNPAPEAPAAAPTTPASAPAASKAQEKAPETAAAPTEAPKTKTNPDVKVASGADYVKKYGEVERSIPMEIAPCGVPRSFVGGEI